MIIDTSKIFSSIIANLEKSANGDMLQYFRDNPNKLKEKLARDKAKKASMTKTAKHSLSADHNPTEGQKEAGNYKKGHIKYDGMDITIENPAGSTRSGISGTGKKWTSNWDSLYILSPLNFKLLLF